MRPNILRTLYSECSQPSAFHKDSQDYVTKKSISSEGGVATRYRRGDAIWAGKVQLAAKVTTSTQLSYDQRHNIMRPVSCGIDMILEVNGNQVKRAVDR